MSTKKELNGNGTLEHRRQEVQQAIKNACDQLNSDGVAPRDYVEQLAWLFFLKAFDEAETRLEEEANFSDTSYLRRLAGQYRWTEWSQLTDKPDEMLKFVNEELWPKLQDLGSDPVGQRFQRIFSSVKNHTRRGTSFARVVQQINRLHFVDNTDVIILSEIYESLLRDVAGDSAGYAGEFYTQRHIIRAMVEVVRPKLRDRVYDPCFGTAGFLAESAEYIRRTTPKLSNKDLDQLNKQTFYGLELKPLTYLLGTMNMLLHRIEGANLELGNTLERHVTNVLESQRFEVILSNPPYGGKLPRELQENFTTKSGATEVLFLQHIMANLKEGGRAAVILPEGVLFRGGPNAKVRERLLKEFDLHTILSLPPGCFLPYTNVKTNVVFFNRPRMLPSKGFATKTIWFYDLTNDGFELRQTRKPIDGSQIPDFLSKWQKQVEGENSWTLQVEEKSITKTGFDLSAKNPNQTNDYEHKPALELIQSVKMKQERISDLLGELEGLLEDRT